MSPRLRIVAVLVLCACMALFVSLRAKSDSFALPSACNWLGFCTPVLSAPGLDAGAINDNGTFSVALNAYVGSGLQVDGGSYFAEEAQFDAGVNISGPTVISTMTQTGDSYFGITTLGAAFGGNVSIDGGYMQVIQGGASAVPLTMGAYPTASSGVALWAQGVSAITNSNYFVFANPAGATILNGDTNTQIAIAGTTVVDTWTSSLDSIAVNVATKAGLVVDGGAQMNTIAGLYTGAPTITFTANGPVNESTTAVFGNSVSGFIEIVFDGGVIVTGSSVLSVNLTTGTFPDGGWTVSCHPAPGQPGMSAAQWRYPLTSIVPTCAATGALSTPTFGVYFGDMLSGVGSGVAWDGGAGTYTLQYSVN